MQRPFRVGHASLQLGSLVMLGIGWYQWQIELNKEDFDFARTPQDQWRRLTTRDGYRFDSNERYLNSGHAFMGAGYYQVGRVNGASLSQAFVFNLATSTLWEIGVEHREVVSVNDQIVTPVAGVPVGESLFAVGELFARSAPTVRNRLLMTIFSPMRAVNWALGDAPRPSETLDRHGVDGTTPHRVDMSLGAAAVVGPAGDGGAWSPTARLDAEILNLRLHGRPGRITSWLRGGESTRFILNYAHDHDGGASAFTWMSSTSLWGQYQHEVDGTDERARRGWSYSERRPPSSSPTSPICNGTS